MGTDEWALLDDGYLEFADLTALPAAIVDRLALNLDPAGNAKPGLVDAVLADIRALAAGVRSARR